MNRVALRNKSSNWTTVLDIKWSSADRLDVWGLTGYVFCRKLGFPYVLYLPDTIRDLFII